METYLLLALPFFHVEKVEKKRRILIEMLRLIEKVCDEKVTNS